MSRRVTLSAVALLFIGLPLVAAAIEPPVGYQLRVNRGTITATPDLSSLLTEENINRLRNGVGLVIRYHLSLKTPRRLFGSRTVAQGSSAAQISFRLLTEDFLIRKPGLDNDTSTAPRGLGGLAEYLADSLEIQLGHIDTLDWNRSYRLDLDITTILLTDISLLAGRGSPEADKEPLEYLFQQFLGLTGYGQSELHYESRPFRISELPSEP